MQSLVTELGMSVNGEPWAYILEQYPGQAVTVAPGWMHSVFNVQCSVKYALEFVEVGNLPAYMQAYRSVSYVHGLNNAEPYMFLMSFALDYISKISLAG
jgi:hypothetical protein